MSQTKKRNRFALFGLLAIVFLTSLAFVAILVLKRSSSEITLDTRKEAMVDSGLVELDTYPFDQSTMKVGEEQKINLQINTKDKSIDAVELIFEIVADDGLLDKNKIKFTGTTPDSLEISKQEIVDSTCTKDCYTATLLLTIKDANTAFATHDQMATISQLSFTPQKEGSLKIKISQDSTAIEHEQSIDVLQKPSVLDFQYYITDNGIDRAQCHFSYTSWGDCNNGWQTRQYSVEPDKCYWYQTDTLAELSQKCVDSDVVSANSNYFYLYSNNTCLNQPTTGESLYIIWDDEVYDDVTWIDVSKNTNFSDFYHKKVSGNIDQTNGDWIIVNAEGFTNATDGSGPLSFQPNTEYFFRLYSTDNDGEHISAVRYYVTYCSGDQSKYKNCNDACGADSDQSKSCAPGMTCYNDVCRNTSNPDNSLCLATPGVSSNDRTCNQYCANNNDCAAGLTCFWNQCRATTNLNNSSCQTTTSTNTTSVTSKTVLLPSEAYDLVTYSCNQGCDSNRDCDADLRCYKGTCRLADDPENTTCVLGTTTEATASSTTQTPVTPTPTITEQSKTSAFIKFLANFSWQWLAFAGAILIAVIALVTSSITRAKKNPWADRVQLTPKTDESHALGQEGPEKTVEIPEDKPLQL